MVGCQRKRSRGWPYMILHIKSVECIHYKWAATRPSLHAEGTLVLSSSTPLFVLAKISPVSYHSCSPHLTFSFCQFSMRLWLLMKMSQSHGLWYIKGLICCFVIHCKQKSVCLYMLKLSNMRGQVFQNI